MSGELDEEGGIQLGVEGDAATGQVRVHFPKPVTWIGMDVAGARELVQLLTAAADAVENGGVAVASGPAGVV